MKLSIKALTLFFIFLTFSSLKSQNNAVDISFDIKNYDNDTLLIGYYYGDRTLVLDTLLAKKKGKFELKREKLLPSGIYLALYQPENSYFQFMINQQDQKFSYKGDKKSDFLVPSGSEDNEIFTNYLSFIGEKSKLRNQYSAEIDSAKAKNKDFKSWEIKLSELDEEVKQKQESIIAKYPNAITTRIIKSNLSKDMPSFEGTDEEKQMQRYLYFRNHYFDFIDLGDPAYLRTPFLHERIDYYLEKLTPQNPDSIAIALDYLLGKMEPAEETFKFYTSHFLNKYANSNIIGFDALYVYLIDNYYTKGKTPWVSEENLEKFVENADKLRPILIGKQAPPITFYDEAGKPVNLYDIKSKYTIMIFWAYDCGHCKKAMPGLKDFYTKYKEKGVEILGICTKHRDKYPPCWEYTKEQELPWITVGDEFHKSNFRDVYNVVSTPRVFILDENKKILLKRVPTEKLDPIMEALIIDLEKIEMEKR